MSKTTPTREPGLLGDTTGRDYSAKLSRFNRFVEPELRKAIESLDLRPGMRVVDAGCGTGEALHWLQNAVGPTGVVIGMDLASAHATAARISAPPEVLVLQADLRQMPLPPTSADFVWCINTINHLPMPLETVRELSDLLRPQGRLVVGQSHFLPDMVFAWDARLERVVTEAVRQYYRDRYGLNERDLAGTRAIVGLLREAGLSAVQAQTLVIERVSPLNRSDRDYLLEAIFRDTWGKRLEPYLAEADYAELTRLCDPSDPGFALARADFHFLQVFTLAEGTAPAR